MQILAIIRNYMLAENGIIYIYYINKETTLLSVRLLNKTVSIAATITSNNKK